MPFNSHCIESAGQLHPVRDRRCVHLARQQAFCYSARRSLVKRQRPGARNCIFCAIPSTQQQQQSTEVGTPHSGYHYAGAKRRFFEGWYFKVRLRILFPTDRVCPSDSYSSSSNTQVTLPGDGQSFAWMYSIEDPAGDGQFSGCGAQVPHHELC